jgi:hypothetical protein
MIATLTDQPLIKMKAMWYPMWYMEITNFFSHPGHFGNDTILFAPNPEGPVSPSAAVGAGTSVAGAAVLVLTAVLSSAVTLMAAMHFLKMQGNDAKIAMNVQSANEYTTI